jgi:hypothetical protein
VSELGFRLVAIFRDFENDFRALPLAFVFREIETVVQNMPNDSLARNEFCDSYFAKMDVFVAIRKLSTERRPVA